MYVVFDYRCSGCGEIEERMVHRSEMDDQWTTCHENGDEDTPMDRLPAGTRTHFRFADDRLKR